MRNTSKHTTLLFLNNLLKQNNLSRTIRREEIIKVMRSGKPLTQQEILERSNCNLNRITLYRTLREFISKGIIVRIQDDDGKEKFFLNTDNKKNHIHFKCIQCSNLYSFPEKSFSYNSLPKGYTAREIKLFITGICNKCS